MSNNHSFYKATSKALPIGLFFGLLVMLADGWAQSLPLPAPPSAPAQTVNGQEPLRYRSPDTPLTIGEISDMQAKKSNEEILKKMGFTSVEPPKPVKEAPVVKEKPKLTVRTLAVWGKPQAAQAEVLVNGSLVKVSGGEALGPGITVKSVSPKAVVLSISKTIEPKGKRKGKGKAPKAEPVIETTQRIAPVGSQVEIEL
jgi:type IV pilus biogenesis protein PilP